MDNEENNEGNEENNNNINPEEEKEVSNQENQENTYEQENNDNNIENNNNNESQNEEQEQEQENNNSQGILTTESVDENYMMELYSKLSKMQQERKEVQSQAQILNNRVNMLKNQEMKNLQKIENSKKMVSDKILRLQEVVENKKILQESVKNKKQEIENKKTKNKILNEELRVNYGKTKALQRKKIEEISKISKAKKEYNKQTYD